MIRFCFWNLNKKPLAEHVRRIVEGEEIDLLVLAESPYSPADLPTSLWPDGSPLMQYCESDCNRIQVLSRFPSARVRKLFGTARYAVQEVSMGSLDFLLVAAHLSSKLRTNAETQLLDAQQFVIDIRREESQAGHERTVVLGDLNMTPFDPGVAACRGLNALMFQEQVAAGPRKCQGRQYPRFYNPMWSRMGDLNAGPPGTYFYSDSNDVCHYWHMLDQILLRPALVPSFLSDEFRILDSDGVEPLLAKQADVTKPSVSDHLPVVFALDL